MKATLTLVMINILFFSSCILQSPKYTTLAKVTSIELGMSKAEVEEILGIKPYNLKEKTDTSISFIYVYRAMERKTLSIDTRPVNGRETIGKYWQLVVSYSKSDKVINIESCNECADNLVSLNKVDFQKIIAFITVTLPVMLVYIGLKKSS